MIRWTTFVATFALLIAFAALPGCTGGGGGKKNADKTKEKSKTDHDHDHGETGPHGGSIVEWEPYHAEFTVDHPSKTVIVYVLDDTVKKAPDLEASRFSKVMLTLVSEKVTVELTHDAKKSGPDGIAFTGSHDFFAKPTAFKKGNLTAILDEKSKKPQPFAGEVDYEPKKAGADKKKTAALRDLYLKPGGIYTAADIQANGNMTAAEKFKDKEWAHAKGIKPGDRICPVTDKKAEAECTWIVQGQRYEFCCPPCVDKFIRQAHFEPESVRNAKDYVFKRT